MDWLAALLLGLLGGGTIGAIWTASLTVSHERAERFRDRQFEAAGKFIADYETALDGAIELWEAATNLVEAKTEAIDAAGPAEQALKEAVGIDYVLAGVAKAINVGVDLIGRDASSQHAAEEIARSRAVVEQAIDNLSGRMEEPFASTTRELLRSLQEASDALARCLKASSQARAQLHRALRSVAQLNLLFAGEDAEVVEAARQVAEALVALMSRILQVALVSAEDSEQESDEISDALQDVNQLLGDFAALANARVRPRPLLQDLGFVKRGNGTPS